MQFFQSIKHVSINVIYNVKVILVGIKFFNNIAATDYGTHKEEF